MEVFNGAGIPAILEREMLLWLRCHVPLCVAFESVSIAGVRRGGGASWAESRVIARGMQEGFVLVQRLGHRLSPRGKSWLHASPAGLRAGMLWFISRLTSFRELLATGIGECRARVTLVEKLDAIAWRFDKGRDPSEYIRHYDDAARILEAEENLPPLGESFERLFEETESSLRLKKLAPANHSAFIEGVAKSRDLQVAHEAIAPMFWSPPLPLERTCLRIRARLEDHANT